MLVKYLKGSLAVFAMFHFESMLQRLADELYQFADIQSYELQLVSFVVMCSIVVI